MGWGGVWGIVPSLDFVGKTSFAWAEGGWGRWGGGAIVPSLNFLGKTSFAWAGGGVGGVGGIVPSLNFVGKTLFALSSHLFAIDVHRHV